MSEDSTIVNGSIMTINQVRQILFNELGLTREFVRELVRDIVSETCEKYFRAGDFEKWLRNQIDHQLRTYQYGSGELKTFIADAVGTAVKKEVTKNLKLRVVADLTPEDSPK